MGDPNVLQYFVQAGFAGLFIWLLWDTRKENRAREQRADERENALMKALDDERQLRRAQESINVQMLATLQSMERRLERMDRAEHAQQAA